MPRKKANTEPVVEEQLDLLGDMEPQEKKIIVQEDGTEEDRTIQEETEQEQPMYRGYDGDLYTEEEWNSPVGLVGPTRKEVEGWKERYNGNVYLTPYSATEIYIWRTLTRPEYREVISDPKITALDREEYFTEKCVLYPYDFSLEKIKKANAGVASLLSEMIMEKSGFVSQSAPIKL